MMGVVVVDKCQGTITTHLRCGVPFSYHITLNLSLSSAVKEFLKLVISEPLRKVTGNTVGCLTHANHLALYYYNMWSSPDN